MGAAAADQLNHECDRCTSAVHQYAMTTTSNRPTENLRAWSWAFPRHPRDDPTNFVFTLHKILNPVSQHFALRFCLENSTRGQERRYRGPPLSFGWPLYMRCVDG